MSKDNNNLTILSGQSVLLPSQNEIQRNSLAELKFA